MLNVTTDGQLLKDLLGHLAGAARGRSSLPILDMLHLEATESHQLRVMGSDLQTWRSASTGCAPGEHEPGACCADAGKLAAISKAVPADAFVTLRHNGERLTIQCGRSRWQLATLPASDYPQPERRADRRSETISPATLATGLQATRAAAPKEDPRHWLCGILVEIDADGQVLLVATDGHRLTRQVLAEPWPALAGDGDEPRRLIVPISSVDALRHLLDNAAEATLSIGDGYLAAAADESLWLQTRLVEGTYPDWRRVILSPSDLPNTATVKREPLIAALQRVMIAAHQGFQGVKLTLAGPELRLHCVDQERREAEDGLDLCAHESTKAEQAIGLRATYLMDCLRALSSEHVQLRYADGEKSVRITPLSADDSHDADDAATLHIIMPMRM